MTTTQEVIDRIRKLRRLATSSNVNEATAAAKIADKLLQEHRLEEAQIEGAEHEGAIEDMNPIALGPRTATWQWYLYTRLAMHYDLACYSSWIKGTRTLHFIGRRGDIEVAKYQMAFYTTEINRLALQTAGGQGRSALNSFRLGAVSGVLAAMKAAKETVLSTSTSMVLADRRKEANEEMNKKHPKMGTAREPNASVSDGLMYMAGQMAGRGIGIPKKGELGE